MKTAVIGAGPAGLSAAYALTRAGVAADVYEASGSVGGLARSLKLWGQTVDVGPHRFFSRDRRVNEKWLEVVGRDYAMVRRLTRILYRGKFYHYPLQPAEALAKLGPFEAARCVASYAGEHLRFAGRNGAVVRRNDPVEAGSATVPVAPADVSSAGTPEHQGLPKGYAGLTRDVFGGTRKTADETPALPEEGTSFESWVCERFGRRLFEIFFKTYSEKLWGIPCDELDADFAAQRIKQFSLSAALKSAFFKNGSRHRTLVDEFAYAAAGTGMVYERMADAVRRNGGEVYLNSPVERVLIEGGKVVGIEFPRVRSSSPQPSPPSDGGEGKAVRLRCDHVISTMPLTLLVERLPGAPAHVHEAARQLTFRNTILVYLEIASSQLCQDQWIYIHSPELRTGRITNFRNWAPQLYGDSPNTILAMEYWCDGGGTTDQEPRTTDQVQILNPNSEIRKQSEPPHVGSYDTESLWRWSDDALIRLARRELVATTLVKDESLILNGKLLRIPRCYPVYRRGYKDLLLPIQEYLSSIRGLQVIGRYGAFKYNNQDHSILMGILAAENILKNAGHDLWSVNADYDTYQEGTRITETGLAPVE